MERLTPLYGRKRGVSQNSSLVTTIYHMIAFPKHKWMIQRIDWLRRSFLWRRETQDKVYGGELANDLPTKEKKGGLAILDLECFARALRLRWCRISQKVKEA